MAAHEPRDADGPRDPADVLGVDWDAIEERKRKAFPYNPELYGLAADQVERALADGNGNGNGHRDEAPADRPILYTLDQVPVEPITWLWPKRIPNGKLTLLIGDPGLAKSFVLTDIAARVSKGMPWPDGSGRAPRGNVVILQAEDGLADTLRPRLDRMGADVSRIIALSGVRSGSDGSERGFSLRRDLAMLEEIVDKYEAALVEIDPLSPYLEGVDSHKDADVRQALAPLAFMADRLGVAVIATLHLNKNNATANALYRASGSLAFTAAARSVLGAAPDPDAEGRNVLLSIKLNVGHKPPGIGYRVTDIAGEGTDTGVIEWDTLPVTVDVATAFGGVRHVESPGMQAAMDLLRAALADGEWHPARDLYDEAAEEGISKDTLKRAKVRLGVEATKGDFNAGWQWRLPRAGV